MKIKKYYILPIISILFVLGIIYTVVLPKITEINETLARISLEKETSDNLNSKIQTLVNLKQNEADIFAQSKIASIALPNQKSIASLITTLDQLVQKSAASISSIQIAPGQLIETRPSIGQNAEELQVNISFSGNIESISNITQRIYLAKRLLNLKSINISSGTEDINATAIITAYYKLRPELPKNVEEKIELLSQEDQDLISKLEEFTTYSPENISY